MGKSGGTLGVCKGGSSNIYPGILVNRINFMGMEKGDIPNISRGNWKIGGTFRGMDGGGHTKTYQGGKLEKTWHFDIINVNCIDAFLLVGLGVGLSWLWQILARFPAGHGVKYTPLELVSINLNWFVQHRTKLVEGFKNVHLL